MVLPEFPDGEFYSCTDPECLTHSDPWEAVEEYLDEQLGPEMKVAEVEAVVGKPLTVTAYSHTPVTDKEIENFSDRLLDSLVEMFDDEHGGPDDPTDPGKAAGGIMLEAVTKIVKGMHCWSCHEVGHVDLTGEQVLEWARAEAPHWFEEEPPKPAPPVIRNLTPPAPAPSAGGETP